MSLGASSAQAGPIEIEYKDYSTGAARSIYIEDLTGSWDQYKAKIQAQPWWGDKKYLTEDENYPGKYGLLNGTIINDGASGKYNNQKFSESDLGIDLGLNFGVNTYEDLSAYPPVYRVNAVNIKKAVYGNVSLYTFGGANIFTGKDINWAITGYAISPSGNLNGGTGLNLSSNLEPAGELLPIFKGGTLTVDQANQAYSQDFTLSSSTENAINNNGYSVKFSGIFSDAPGESGNIAFRPNGNYIEISGRNTYTGITIIDVGGTYGTLVSRNGAIPDSSDVYLFSPYSQLVILGGDETIASLNSTHGNGTVDLKGNNLSLGSTSSRPSVFTGSIKDSSGQGEIIKTGSNLQALTGTNIYTGSTSIQGGTLALTSGGSISQSRLIGIDQGAIFDISNTTSGSSIKGLSGTGSVVLGAKDLAITGTTSGANAGGGSFDGVISGTGGLTVDLNRTGQGGLFSLNGANTYSGATTISSGSLAVNGSTTSPVSVQSGGTLQGTGVITGDVVNEGNLSPGNSIGTLTVDGNYFQALSNPNAALNIEVDGSTSDLLKITGSSRGILLGGNLNISSYQGAPISSNLIYTAIDVTGSDPRGGELSLKTNLNVVGSSGLKFVRETDPDFATLSRAASDYYKICTNTDPSIQQGCTKLQFAWLKVNPQTSTPIIPTTISTPGVQTIQSVKQTGGAITTASSGNVAANNATCTSNSGSSANCQQINQPGTGSSGHNTNTIGAAKTLDAGWASLSAASSSGVSGGSAIQSPAGTNTGYTTAQTSAALVTPDFVNVIGALFSIPTRQQLNQALHSISAEPYASMQSVALEALEQFRANTIALTAGRRLPFYTEEQVCKDSQHNGSDSNNATTSPQTDASTPCDTVSRQKLTPWSLLIDGSNTQASLNGTNDLASLDYNIFSSSYGLQYDFNRNWSAGAAFGYGRANLYNYEYSNARINSDTYSGAAWGIYRPSDAWKFTALAGYMNLQYDSSRNINFGGLDRNAVANWSGNGFTSALAAEYDWVLSSDQSSRSAVRIKPNTFFSYALHRQGAFSETGAQSLNLALDSHTADSLIYGIGFSLETPIITGKTSRLIPRLSIGYEYDFNGDSNEEHQLTSSFAEVPALGSFDVLGQNRGANAVDVALALEFETSDTLSLYSNVGGAFWSNGNELSYGAGLRLRW